MNRARVGVLFAVAMLGMGLADAAQAANLSLNQPYAYFTTFPGQSENSGPHYRDDWTVHGLHDVHTSGLGTYDVGDFTDGVVQPDANVCCVPTPIVGIYGTANAPPVELIFDLGSTSIVDGVNISTFIGASVNNNAPDDVTISFSTTGTASGDFGSAQFFDLEGTYGPLADGHQDLPMVIPGVSARYVKLAFDGGSMAEPGGSDPNEKYVMDEITITGSPIPEPATGLLALLGLVAIVSGRIARRRRVA